MPDLGEGLEEGEIVEWLVAEGEAVDAEPADRRGGDREGDGGDPVAVRRRRSIAPARCGRRRRSRSGASAGDVRHGGDADGDGPDPHERRRRRAVHAGAGPPVARDAAGPEAREGARGRSRRRARHRARRDGSPRTTCALRRMRRQRQCAGGSGRGRAGSRRSGARSRRTSPGRRRSRRSPRSERSTARRSTRSERSWRYRRCPSWSRRSRDDRRASGAQRAVDDRGHRCTRRACTSGIAADTERGLVVPVVHDVQAARHRGARATRSAGSPRRPRGRARPDGDERRDDRGEQHRELRQRGGNADPVPRAPR